jgi:hypothetical protein
MVEVAATVSAVTKSETNDFTGSMFAYNRDYCLALMTLEETDVKMIFSTSQYGFILRTN